MSVLKDASATAIYGSRGANGVVLITTKAGSQGTQVTYSSSYSSSSVIKDPDLLKKYAAGDLWPLTLTKEQRVTATALCDLIIPEDEQSPAASKVGVVDFIDIGVGSYRWPTFNIADIAVTCGAIALALSFWREDVQRSETASAG